MMPTPFTTPSYEQTVPSPPSVLWDMDEENGYEGVAHVSGGNTQTPTVTDTDYPTGSLTKAFREHVEWLTRMWRDANIDVTETNVEHPFSPDVDHPFPLPPMPRRQNARVP